MIDDHDFKLDNNKDQIKFLLSVNDDTFLTTNYSTTWLKMATMMSYGSLNKSHRTAHHGPLSVKHTDYKGSTFNILIELGEWKTTIMEPLQIIANDDPVTFAMYAKDNGLLDTPGWKQFKSLAKRATA
jgi:hypothetical protein